MRLLLENFLFIDFSKDLLTWNSLLFVSQLLLMVGLEGPLIFEAY